MKAFTDRSRKPFRQANRMPFQIEKLIVQVKKEFPTWGAPKIRERIHTHYPDVALPAKSTVHVVLDRNGLVTKKRRRRTRLEGTSLSDPLVPNTLWCTDYKGEFMLGNKNYCYPLTVSDYASRFLICCEGKKIHFSTVFAGQDVGLRQVEDDVWLVSFMEYDMGYFDLESHRVQALENPFGPKVLTM